MGAKRYAEESFRDQKFMAIYLEERLYYMLEGQRHLRQMQRVAKMEWYNTRYRTKSLIRKINEAEGMVIEVR